ncbi:hypothetical protein QAD02_002207 [Eretmocerus hayati]|uniref:Uncharacterized protein n=1 Tax=Eretmocerus hayati TaxID=131215 RepID=A0ACC2NJ82_9HYME|nr:hypothetical protein QAD02_002207 [Eretmocerus hayati]
MSEGAQEAEYEVVDETFENEGDGSSMIIRERDLLASDDSENYASSGDDEVHVTDDELQNSISTVANHVCELQEEQEDHSDATLDGDPILPVSSNTQKRRHNPKQLARKRQRHPDKWEKNIQKERVSLGQAYTSSHTKKSMKRGCGPGCRKKCGTKISDDERTANFNTLWKIRSHSQKYSHLMRHVTENSINCEEPTKRKFSRRYFLRGSEGNVEVCQTMFLNTLSISKQMVDTACAKLRNGNVELKDNRGSTGHKPREITLEEIEGVKRHIDSFPRIEAHYVRSTSGRDYL